MTAAMAAVSFCGAIVAATLCGLVAVGGYSALCGVYSIKCNYCLLLGYVLFLVLMNILTFR